MRCQGAKVGLALPRGPRQESNINRLAQGLGNSDGIEIQSVSRIRPKPKFEPVEHFVYLGRERIGRHIKTTSRRYAAARERLLSHYGSRVTAYNAAGKAAAGGAQ